MATVTLKHERTVHSLHIYMNGFLQLVADNL